MINNQVSKYLQPIQIYNQLQAQTRKLSKYIKSKQQMVFPAHQVLENCLIKSRKLKLEILFIRQFKNPKQQYLSTLINGQLQEIQKLSNSHFISIKPNDSISTVKLTKRDTLLKKNNCFVQLNNEKLLLSYFYSLRKYTSQIKTIFQLRKNIQFKRMKKGFLIFFQNSRYLNLLKIQIIKQNKIISNLNEYLLFTKKSSFFKGFYLNYLYQNDLKQNQLLLENKFRTINIEWFFLGLIENFNSMKQLLQKTQQYQNSKLLAKVFRQLRIKIPSDNKYRNILNPNNFQCFYILNKILTGLSKQYNKNQTIKDIYELSEVLKLEKQHFVDKVTAFAFKLEKEVFLYTLQQLPFMLFRYEEKYLFYQELLAVFGQQTLEPMEIMDEIQDGRQENNQKIVKVEKFQSYVINSIGIEIKSQQYKAITYLKEQLQRCLFINCIFYSQLKIQF